MRFLLPLVCPLWLGVSAWSYAAPEVKPMPAILVQPRDGLRHVLAKLRAGEPVKIAYLGGSITAAAGWRVMSREWFQKEFPRAKVSEIQAAIGGTGSDLGVFRLKADVLQHQPDLLFVEFAVNDGNAPPRQIWRSMEGIVRQTWAALPTTDICFVYTFAVGHEKDLQEGRCPPAAAAMEQLAAHYGVPSINVALKVVQLQRAGKLIYQSDHPTGPGVMQFSTDGVHPLETGHQLYTDVIGAAVTEIAKQPKPADHAAALATPFVADHWQAAKQLPVSPAMLSPEWTRVDPEAIPFKFFRERLGTIWEATKPGSRLSFKFRGSLVKLFDIVGPDGGQVIVTVDGRSLPRPVARFDSFCTYHRLATLPIAEGLDRNVVHTVVLEVHPEQPDRSSIAPNLKNPDQELKSSKYNGTKLWAGQILMLGELVE
jgi:lysophospholipase L1-like esterase